MSQLHFNTAVIKAAFSKENYNLSDCVSVTEQAQALLFCSIALLEEQRLCFHLNKASQNVYPWTKHNTTQHNTLNPVSLVDQFQDA